MKPSNNAGPADWISRQQQDKRKRAAWQQAAPVQGYDADYVRIDAYGSYMIWAEYGQTATHGWEIDHELPKSLFPALSNQPANLRALHWRNNRKKSNLLDLDGLSRLLRGN